jgi:hypothetical protein
MRKNVLNETKIMEEGDRASLNCKENFKQPNMHVLEVSKGGRGA